MKKETRRLVVAVWETISHTFMNPASLASQMQFVSNLSLHFHFPWSVVSGCRPERFRGQWDRNTASWSNKTCEVRASVEANIYTKSIFWVFGFSGQGIKPDKWEKTLDGGWGQCLPEQVKPDLIVSHFKARILHLVQSHFAVTLCFPSFVKSIQPNWTAKKAHRGMNNWARWRVALC